jgi:DNA-binding MarR family transcriptional regulator
MRAAALAEHLQSDPSTVSRQVAALVKDGYLDRRADPADGRASLLVLTPKAERLLAEHRRRRNDFFARVLDGWSNADLKRFAALLERFGESYELANNDWIAQRAFAPSRPTGSHS